MYRIELTNGTVYDIPDMSLNAFMHLNATSYNRFIITHIPDAKTKEQRRQELYNKAFSGATMTKDEEAEMKRLYHEEEYLAGLDGD